LPSTAAQPHLTCIEGHGGVSQLEETHQISVMESRLCRPGTQLTLSEAKERRIRRNLMGWTEEAFYQMMRSSEEAASLSH
ncbi:hypothetical protein KUCAC02_024084, partial [Chaenocephalus aceratus]